MSSVRATRWAIHGMLDIDRVAPIVSEIPSALLQRSILMADKSPKRPSTKKVGMSLKERRSAKKVKKDPAIGASSLQATRAKNEAR